MNEQARSEEQARPIRVTIDQLIALCDEMAALARSGIPFERGMLSMASELPGQLGHVAAEIGARGESGESLEQILQSDRLKMPEILRAVILAGVRSGRLSAALEGMATSTRRIADLRCSIIQATIYPLIVLVLVCALCLLVLTRLSVAYSDALTQHRVADWPWGIAVMEFVGKWMWMLGPAAIVAVFAWWFFTGQATSLQPRRLSRWLRCVPWTQRLLRHGRLSTFADVLALLLEQDVPLPEAITLAGEASGDEALRRDASELAAGLASGSTTVPTETTGKAIPRLVRWQLTSQTSTRQMIASLQATARAEQRRADYLAEWLRIQLPVILTVGVGGVATLIYALATMAPWYSLLGRFANPS